MTHNYRFSISTRSTFLAICIVMMASGLFSQEADNSFSQSVPVPVPRDAVPSIAEAVEAHLGYVTDYSLDQYGRQQTGIWLGQIDIRTSGLPNAQGSDKAVAEQPWVGSNLYLDQPTMVAAVELGRRTGCKCYQESITRYLEAHVRLLKRNSQSPKTQPLDFRTCLDSNYDLFLDRYVLTNPKYFSTGIYSPAWEILWQESNQLTRRAIESLTQDVLSDTQVRNDSPEAITSDENGQFHKAAISLSAASWLLENHPMGTDSLRNTAAQISRLRPRRENDLTPRTLTLWTRALMDFDKATGSEATPSNWQPGIDNRLRSHQQLQISGTQDIRSAFSSGGANKFNGRLAWAELCLTAWKETGKIKYRDEAKRYADVLTEQFREKPLKKHNAETYGRVLHFLHRFGKEMKNTQYSNAAKIISKQALQQLYSPKMGMFHSHPDTNRCDSREGIGFLLLALLYLDGHDPTETSAVNF